MQLYSQSVEVTNTPISGSIREQSHPVISAHCQPLKDRMDYKHMFPPLSGSIGKQNQESSRLTVNPLRTECMTSTCLSVIRIHQRPEPPSHPTVTTLIIVIMTSSCPPSYRIIRVQCHPVISAHSVTSLMIVIMTSTCYPCYPDPSDFPLSVP